MTSTANQEACVMMGAAFMKLRNAHLDHSKDPENLYPKLNSFEPGDVWNFCKEQFELEEYDAPSTKVHVWASETDNSSIDGCDCIVFYGANAICIVCLEYKGLKCRPALYRATMVVTPHGCEFKIEDNVDPKSAITAENIASPEFKNSLLKEEQ